MVKVINKINNSTLYQKDTPLNIWFALCYPILSHEASCISFYFPRFRNNWKTSSCDCESSIFNIVRHRVIWLFYSPESGTPRIMCVTLFPPFSLCPFLSCYFGPARRRFIRPGLHNFPMALALSIRNRSTCPTFDRHFEKGPRVSLVLCRLESVKLHGFVWK